MMHLVRKALLVAVVTVALATSGILCAPEIAWADEGTSEDQNPVVEPQTTGGSADKDATPVGSALGDNAEVTPGAPNESVGSTGTEGGTNTKSGGNPAGSGADVHDGSGAADDTGYANDTKPEAKGEVETTPRLELVAARAATGAAATRYLRQFDGGLPILQVPSQTADGDFITFVGETARSVNATAAVMRSRSFAMQVVCTVNTLSNGSWCQTSDGALSRGDALANEGISGDAQEIRVQADNAFDQSRYSIWYRVMVENVGWLDWAQLGNEAGVRGVYGHVLSGYEVRVLNRGAGAPGAIQKPVIQAVNGKVGWQNPGNMWQVSSNTVNAWWRHGHGIFSYASPSQISPVATRDQVVEAFIQRAYDYRGTGYIWDYACAPGVGVDCAGLVVQCCYAVGMDLGDMNPYNHYYAGGWHAHYANAFWDSSKIVRVDAAHARRGDLVCYPGHVAIYLGGGRMIEAIGSDVHESDVRWGNLRGFARLFA